MRIRTALTILSVALAAALVASACERAPQPTQPPAPSALLASQATDVEPNNSCPTAQDVGTISFPFTLSGDLVPILPLGDVDFFRLKGPANATVKVDLEGQSTGKGTLVDPFLGIFDVNCNAIVVTDTGGVGLNAAATISIPGDSVFIVGVSTCCDFSIGGNGSYELTVQELAAPTPPPNDDFINATLISALPFSGTVDLTAASVEPGEPTPTCALFSGVTRTAWYKFTPGNAGSLSASDFSATFSTVVAAYTGTSVNNLNQVGCGVFGQQATFRAAAGTTYYVQVAGLFGQAGPLQLRLEVTPPPEASFFFFPFDPTVFDAIQFSDVSFDSGGVGFASRAWDFGDGSTVTTSACCVTHTYAADGDYNTQLTVTTFDGRIASTTQPVRVRTHDVAITRFSTPTAASTGQTRHIVVGVNSRRYVEVVEVQLLKSVPGGFEMMGSLTQSVPIRSSNRTTDFDFSYTFTADDARIGKVTFKAVATINGVRDALPADNEAIASPTKVNP